MGTLVIPNTVALIKDGPNPDQGKALIDFLLRPETEACLAGTRSIQIPLNPRVKAPENVPDLAKIKTMAVDFGTVAGEMPKSAVFIREEFLK